MSKARCKECMGSGLNADLEVEELDCARCGGSGLEPL